MVNVENACASGTTALIEAATWVALGRCDVALAVGFDRVASAGGGLIALPPDDPLAGVGVTLPALYALLGNRYLHEAGATARELAAVVVKSRRHATGNPYACMRNPLTLEDVLTARPIADPLTLYMCTPNADGAAAAVLVSDRARQMAGSYPVRLRAAAIRAGLVQDRLEEPSIVADLAREVYEAAGLGPEEVDVAEVHDAFAPAEPMLIEKLGFAPHGEALDRLARGHYALGGPGVTVNPSGGLLSRGHPPGATGLAQVYEVVTQLRGQAGPRQVANARVGLVHNQGGTVLDIETNACVVLILTR